MANATNKHKAHGKKPVVKKESWWTLGRIKAAVAACVVVVLVLIGVGIYNYVDGLQDSIIGEWSNQYEASDTGDAMEVLFYFNEDMTCSFTRTRNGEAEANMTGVYDIDDNYDVISMMMGSDGSTILQYYYDCDGDDLEMKNFSTGTVDNYTKVK